MTEAGLPEGWERMANRAFGMHVGPFFRRVEGGLACGFRTDDRHGNRRGVTHGGSGLNVFQTTEDWWLDR